MLRVIALVILVLSFARASAIGADDGDEEC
jgi:hypothetical protein